MARHHKETPMDESEIRNLKEPIGSESAEIGEVGERHYADPRVRTLTTKLPSATTALSWLDKIAVLAHESNRLWCELHGDQSQASYVDAPDWQKDSVHTGVGKIASGEITTPEQAHDSWAQQKFEDGWQHGEVKDPEAKTHPALVPYDQLPPEQKAKDSIFFGIVQGLIEHFRSTGNIPRPTPPFADPRNGSGL
jgi:predicted transcriptional regulator